MCLFPFKEHNWWDNMWFGSFMFCDIVFEGIVLLGNTRQHTLLFVSWSGLGYSSTSPSNHNNCSRCCHLNSNFASEKNPVDFLLYSERFVQLILKYSTLVCEKWVETFEWPASMTMGVYHSSGSTGDIVGKTGNGINCNQWLTTLLFKW